MPFRLLSADAMLLAFVFVLFIHWIEKKLDKIGWGPPIYLRYWSLLGCLQLGWLCGVLHNLTTNVMLVSGWLDAEVTTALVRQRMTQEGDLDGLSEWQEQASLEHYPLLRAFSMTSPGFVVATFAVSLKHVAMHGSAMKRHYPQGELPHAEKVIAHDKSVRILFLPMFYSLMSLQAVQCMWEVSVNSCGTSHHFGAWTERRDFLMETYSSSFSVGDVYESYALLVFATLIMRVLKQQVNEMVLEARAADNSRLGDKMRPSSSSRLEEKHSRRRLNSGGSLDSNSRSRNSSLLNHGSSMEFQNLTRTVNDLVVHTKGLTILGIKLFCMTCAGQAFYSLMLQTCGFYNICAFWFSTGVGSLGLLQTAKAKDVAKNAFYGAGFVASFAAIGNVIEVEHGFRNYLHEFGAFWKFVGVKVLVSLAFLQSIVLAMLPPFCFWSPIRSNLFYASLICMECFLISILHLWAWRPSETWYSASGCHVSAYDLFLLPDPPEEPKRSRILNASKSSFGAALEPLDDHAGVSPSESQCLLNSSPESEADAVALSVARHSPGDRHWVELDEI